MNSLQRYNAMLRGEKVDHLPRIPILMQLAAEHIGSNYGPFCSDYGVKVEGNLRCAEDFGLDLVGVMSDPYTETQAFGAEIIYHDHTTPACAAPPLEETRDLAALAAPDPLTSTRMASTLQAIRCYRQQVGDRYPILGWVEGPAAEAADLRGIARFMMDLIDDPIWSPRCCKVRRIGSEARSVKSTSRSAIHFSSTPAARFRPARPRRIFAHCASRSVIGRDTWRTANENFSSSKFKSFHGGPN